MLRSSFRWLVGLLAVWLAVGAWASWFPAEPPPSPASARFLSWAEEYVQDAVESVPLARAKTFHFSPSGSDTAGDGSPANPFRSIAKANQILEESGGNVRLRFARGGVWRGSENLRVMVPAVTIDSYVPPGGSGGAPKPLFTRFEPPVAPWVWVADAPGVCRLLVAEPVAWVKYVGDEVTVFRRFSSVSEVRATPGSWTWENGTLWVHGPNGLAVNNGDRRIEYVLKNQLDGIDVGDVDSVRIAGLQIEGFGTGTPRDHSYTGYAIRLGQSGPRRAVVEDCETYYNGRHSITKVSNDAGGSLVVVRCRLGWLVNDGINIVSYAHQGRHELVSAYNEFLGGILPNGPRPYPGGGSGGTNYMHSSSVFLTLGLMLCLENRIVPGPYQNSEVSLAEGAPTVNQLSDARAFVIGEIAPCRTPNATDAAAPTQQGGSGLMYTLLGSRFTLYINCQVEIRALWGMPGDTGLLVGAYGIWANSDILFDFSALPPTAWNRTAAVSPHNAPIMNFMAEFTACRIRFIGPPGGATMGFSGPMVFQYGTNRNTLAAAWQGRLTDSIVDFVGRGTGDAKLGFGNDPSRLWGNAYFGISTESGAWGVDKDGGRMVGESAPGRPLGSSDWARRSKIRWYGETLEYDATGRPRSMPTTVGPLEALTSRRE